MHYGVTCRDPASGGLLDSGRPADYGSSPCWKARPGNDGVHRTIGRVDGPKDDIARALGEMPRLPLKVGTHGYFS